MSVSTEVLKVGAGFAGISALAAAARHVYIEVPQEHVALRTHSDRAIRRRDTWLTGQKAGGTYGKVGAGYHATLGLRDYKMISLQDNVDALQDFAVDLDDKKQRIVRSEVAWGVVNAPEDKEGELVYRALYNANGEEALKTAVVNICGSGLRKVILGLDKPEAATSEDVQPRLIEECNEELVYTYGVELRRLYLIEAAETLVSAIGNRSLSHVIGNPNNGHKEIDVTEIAAAAAGMDAATISTENGGLQIVRHQAN